MFANRKLDLRVDDDEFEQPSRPVETGIATLWAVAFGALYAAHVTQADQGCDFDFLHAGAEDS